MMRGSFRGEITNNLSSPGIMAVQIFFGMGCLKFLKPKLPDWNRN